MKKETVINYNDVRKFIKENMKTSIDSIVDAVEPFAMDYITLPVGFAETDNYNDMDKLIREIELGFYMITSEPDGRVRKGLVSRNIKKEQERWKERNAGFFGRHIGRLAYLLNEKSK